MRRFFTPDTTFILGQTIVLPEAEAEHLRKSLRMSVGDPVIVFNGQDQASATISKISRAEVTVAIQNLIENTSESTGPEFTLVQGMIRLPNFELILQKVTELGVTNIVPLTTEFSQIPFVSLDNKRTRWEKIVVEACKQSERAQLPVITETASFQDLPTLLTEVDLVLLLTTERESIKVFAPIRPITDFADQIRAARRVAYLIGPEGGFSPTEHKQAAELGIPFVSIGSQILRAETAAIATQAILNYICLE